VLQLCQFSELSTSCSNLESVTFVSEGNQAGGVDVEDTFATGDPKMSVVVLQYLVDQFVRQPIVGGEELRLIPSLNADPFWVNTIADWIVSFPD